jgi:hypothetical protein
MSFSGSTVEKHDLEAGLVWCANDARQAARSGRKVMRGFLLAYLSGVASGCYVNMPVVAAPQPGAVLNFDLNDRGRVGLGENLGPAVLSIQGTLGSQTDSVYAIGVSQVGYLNGQSNKWNGEALTIPKAFVRDVSERKYSRSRTYLVAAAAAAGFVAFAASRHLLGLGSPDRDPGTQPPGGDAILIPVGPGISH